MMETFDVVAHMLSYTHACVNPIIYTFAAPGFRKSSFRIFTSLVCCKLCVSLCNNGRKHLVMSRAFAATENLAKPATTRRTRSTRSSTSATTVDLKLSLIPNLKMTSTDVSDFHCMTSRKHANAVDFKLQLKREWMMMSELQLGDDATSNKCLNYKCNLNSTDVDSLMQCNLQNFA